MDSQTHPLVDNAQQYIVEKKYVSVHSEDRNILKYPDAAQFELELPQDYLNITSVKLSSWSFPSNYDTFSVSALNSLITFQFLVLYNPADHIVSPDPLAYLVYTILLAYENQYGTTDWFVLIGNGFYTPMQLATELTNKFNAAVTAYVSAQLVIYDAAHGTSYNTAFLNPTAEGVPQAGYTDFVFAFNHTSQKMWLGNRSATFQITDNAKLSLRFLSSGLCFVKGQLPDDSQPNGLASYLGLCGATASTATADLAVPRFYYGDVLTVGDNGYWLVPVAANTGSTVSYIDPPNKLNSMGPAYFYLEIAELNCMDETSPYNVSLFTQQTNKTNGVVNAAFAKIGIVSTPLSQFYDCETDAFKYYNPPLQRLRQIRVRLRYHNGKLVNFSNFPYSFTLEFTMLTPQINRVFGATRSYVS